MATVAAIVSIGATAVSVHKGNVAARAQRKQSAIEQRAQEISNSRARAQAVRDAQIAQAANINLVAATGGSVRDNSALTGANESIQSQAASAVGFSTFQSSAGLAESQQAQRAIKFTQQSQTAQAIGNLPSQLGVTPSFSNVYKSAKRGFSAVLDAIHPGNQPAATQVT